MNKKGQQDEIVFLAIIVMVLAVVIGIIMMTRGVVQTSLDTKAIEASSYLEAIMHSPHGIMEVNDGKVNWHAIDASKFNSAQLDNFLKISSKLEEYPAARLVLMNTDTGESKEIYWNRVWYDRLLEKVGFFGGQSAYSLTRSYFVNEKVGDDLLPSKLIITMVIP